MPCLAKFAPTGLDIRDDGASDHVGLRFENGPDYFEVVFLRQALPVLFDQIVRSTRADKSTAMTAENLAGTLVLEGHDTLALPDGGVELTLHFRTDDGMRSISWAMTSEKA